MTRALANMFLEQKNKFQDDWRPSASIEYLKKRAHILTNIRAFFCERNILEVDTPLLCHTSVTDPYIQSIAVPLHSSSYYLQTSPEYAMKRLLAAGSGSIYQICKAFRQDELGRLHQIEFSLLEWYRINYNHHDLMVEMDELLQHILQTQPAEKVSYRDVFNAYCNLDPLTSTLAELVQCAKNHDISFTAQETERDTWLMLLFTQVIEPHLGKTNIPTFIYDYPISQSALARINQDGLTAARFEVYLNGIELANGFHELQDAAEQRLRFQNNLMLRQQLQLPEIPIDEYLLAALAAGLPNCAGVALGIDRLIMLALKAKHITNVISFDHERA